MHLEGRGSRQDVSTLRNNENEELSSSSHDEDVSDDGHMSSAPPSSRTLRNDCSIGGISQQGRHHARNAPTTNLGVNGCQGSTSLLPNLARLDLESEYIGKMFSEVASTMSKRHFPLATDESTDIDMSQLDQYYGEMLSQRRRVPPISTQTDKITEHNSNDLAENGHNPLEDVSFTPLQSLKVS
eukprot:Seg1794.1 transcript_id=Seg1794.1/GoldUCD/mRNA.D3Y31 product="hypothetical protein" protein_id=Seg1794.1/GoldUCD/D3Y31